MPEILTRFRRPDAPETMEIEDLGQRKCRATRPMSSALALPSTGEERRRAIQAPEPSVSSELAEEYGFARTVRMSELSPADFVARRAVIFESVRRRDAGPSGCPQGYGDSALIET